jgi:hypothetical protein
VDGRPLPEDDPGAEEADPGDDGGRHAGHVELDVHVLLTGPELLEAERGDHAEQGGAERHREVSPEPREVVGDLPLHPHQCAQPGGHEQADHHVHLDVHGP